MEVEGTQTFVSDIVAWSVGMFRVLILLVLCRHWTG